MKKKILSMTAFAVMVIGVYCVSAGTNLIVSDVSLDLVKNSASAISEVGCMGSGWGRCSSGSDSASCTKSYSYTNCSGVWWY